MSLNNQDYSRKMILGLLIAFCSKYSVGMASSVTNNSAEGASPELEWLPAAEVGGYWCAALLVLMVATCAARRRYRHGGAGVAYDSDERAARAAALDWGLCERMAHCWPWSPHVTESPLASQIQLGRDRFSQAQSLCFEQLVESSFVHSRAIPMEILFWEGRGDGIGEQVSLVEIEDQKDTKTSEDGREELASSGDGELTSHRPEELAGSEREELASYGNEDLASQIHDELVGSEPEELASHEQEELVSRGHEDPARRDYEVLTSLRGHEELARRGHEELALRGHEELARRGHEELALRGHEELARRGLEELARRGHEELASKGQDELAGDERGEVASSVVQEAVERVWVEPVRRKLRLQEVSSEPLPARDAEDFLKSLEDDVVPVAEKPEGSSHVYVSKTETSPPFASVDDKEITTYASKQVTFSDKLRRFTKREEDESSSSKRAAAAGKTGAHPPPCPLHSIGGPLSRRPSVKSLPSTRDGDVLDQEIEYSEDLCTCPPSKKESPRLVGVGSGTNQPAPATEDDLKRQVEVVRILSRYSSFVPDDEKDAVPKDPLTIPKSWVPIQEQAAYARSSTSAEGTRLADTLSEIASRESRTTPERRRFDVAQVSNRRGTVHVANRREEQFITDEEQFISDEEQFISGEEEFTGGQEQFTGRRGIKRYRNEGENGYVTPAFHRNVQSKSRAVILDPPQSRPKSRNVAAQTSPIPSPPPRRIYFSEVGTQVQQPEVRSAILGADSMEAFASTVNKTPSPSMRQSRSGSVVTEQVVKGGSKIPSSCFIHDIVPSLQMKRKRSLISIRSEETETPGVQYWEEPKYTIAPATVSVPTENFLSPSKVYTTRHHGEYPYHKFAGEGEAGLSTQWDLLHNFPSSAARSPAGDNEYVPYTTRNSSAFEEGVDIPCKTRPHSVCSTVTEKVLPKGVRSKFRPLSDAHPDSVEMLYNRNGKRLFSDSVSATPTSDAEEFTVYLECHCPDAVRDYEQEKSFKKDESLIYGFQPAWDHSPTESRGDSWGATPDYQPASPTVTEPPATHPIAQQRPTVAAHALTADQKTMLHWKIVVHPKKGSDGEGSSDLVPERGPPQRGRQDATPRQK